MEGMKMEIPKPRTNRSSAKAIPFLNRRQLRRSLPTNLSEISLASRESNVERQVWPPSHVSLRVFMSLHKVVNFFSLSVIWQSFLIIYSYCNIANAAWIAKGSQGSKEDLQNYQPVTLMWCFPICGSSPSPPGQQETLLFPFLT